MSDLNSLAKALMEIDDLLASCMKCGFCQAFCPVFDQTRKEGDVTRGKIALTENLARLVIQDPDQVYEKLSHCLLCGSCAYNCPSGVKTMDIFIAAREAFANYNGLNAIEKAIFRTLLPNPRILDTLMRVGSPFQKLIVKKEEDKVQDTARAPLMKAFIGAERRIPVVADKSFHATHGKINMPVGKSGLKVVYYPGCMGDLVYTKVSDACMKIFDYHGVGVFMADNFACCGMPAMSHGERNGILKMLRHNLDILQDVKFDYIITPCASCTEMIKEYWPRYAEDLEPQYRRLAKDIAEKSMEINQFVVDVLKIQASKHRGGTPVTYHESCHLRMGLGISAQPRVLINVNQNMNLVEMNEADHCCGCGGSFTLDEPELSREIGQRKRDNIVNSGAAIVATGCPACMMQLNDMLSRNHDKIVVKHTAEIYADTLK